jgi:hypothetical protein
MRPVDPFNMLTTELVDAELGELPEVTAVTVNRILG